MSESECVLDDTLSSLPQVAWLPSVVGDSDITDTLLLPPTVSPPEPPSPLTHAQLHAIRAHARRSVNVCAGVSTFGGRPVHAARRGVYFESWSGAGGRGVGGGSPVAGGGGVMRQRAAGGGRNPPSWLDDIVDSEPSSIVGGERRDPATLQMGARQYTLVSSTPQGAGRPALRTPLSTTHHGAGRHALPTTPLGRVPQGALRHTLPNTPLSTTPHGAGGPALRTPLSSMPHRVGRHASSTTPASTRPRGVGPHASPTTLASTRPRGVGPHASPRRSSSLLSGHHRPARRLSLRRPPRFPSPIRCRTRNSVSDTLLRYAADQSVASTSDLLLRLPSAEQVTPRRRRTPGSPRHAADHQVAALQAAWEETEESVAQLPEAGERLLSVYVIA